MTTATRTPTVRAVNAALKASGCERAGPQPGGLVTAGYHVHRTPGGQITVNWWGGSGQEYSRAERNRCLARYAEAIRAAGFAVQDGYDHPQSRSARTAHYLIVSQPEPGYVHVVEHLDGNPRNNDPANLSIEPGARLAQKSGSTVTASC